MRTNLRQSEEIVTTTQRHPLSVLSLYVLTVVILILWISLGKAKMQGFAGYTLGMGFLVVAIISVFKTFAWQKDIWVVTNQRVVDEHGVLTVRCLERPLDKITNVMVSQSVPGRLFGYGTIRIQTAGQAGVAHEARVMRPNAFRNAIFEQQKIARETAPKTGSLMEAAQPAAQGDMRECPFCAEWIKAKAKICRFCDREVPPLS